jgi:hypothetical protein
MGILQCFSRQRPVELNRDVAREVQLVPEIYEVLGGLSAWPAVATRLAAMSRRTKRLGRLGNAVVPACAEYMARGIIAFDRATSGGAA